MVTKYTIYTANGSETLASICRQLSVAAFDVIRINEATTSQTLLRYQMSGEVLPRGFYFKAPISNTGMIETNDESYEIYESLGGLGGTEFTSGYSGVHSKMKGRSSGNQAWKDFNCSVYTLLNGVPGPAWSLPVYPQEFSDNNSGNFSSQSILGRSVDYQIYQGSSRSVNFTLNLHNELSDDYGYVHDLVAYIESACYPGYSSGIVQVPEICFIIGSQFKIRGVLESCSATWKSPIIDGKLVNCDLSISIKETTGPYSNSQVKSMGGKRG